MKNFAPLLAVFVAAVAGLPHVGMIDTPVIRDVGLIFDDKFYRERRHPSLFHPCTDKEAGGNSTFILEIKDKPTCVPINVDSSSRPQ